MKCLFGFFFFFQAEDGIRDADVTGVQTCALPISCTERGSIARGASLAPPTWTRSSWRLRRVDPRTRSRSTFKSSLRMAGGEFHLSENVYQPRRLTEIRTYE